jgi:hypothetical protein
MRFAAAVRAGDGMSNQRIHCRLHKAHIHFVLRWLRGLQAQIYHTLLRMQLCYFC